MNATLPRSSKFIAALPPDTELGDYVIERLLGQGGFGSTYLAFDARIHKQVAIKELTPYRFAHRGADGHVLPNGGLCTVAFNEMKNSFLTEARVLAKFKHPNIANVLRYFEANGTAYMVMGYEEGTTLSAWIRSSARNISEVELEAILFPICSGLSLLHSEGLIHRDIKPDNIIVRPDGSPCLLDFGAALPLSHISSGEHVDIIATPHYAPPEQYNFGGTQGPWTDLYALGATLYKLVTGQLPPAAITRLALDSFDPASNLARGKYSSRLLTLIDQCLALDPEERPTSVEDLLRSLLPEDDRAFALLLHNVSLKMIVHFMNWAKPNDGLLADELALFVAAFPIIDLSWRLSEEVPSQETFSHLLDLRLSSASILDTVVANLRERGFTHMSREPNHEAVIGRLNQYAASYLLDRQAEEWNYELTRKQLVKQCLVSPSEEGRAGFSSLMEAVINRARGRVKRGLRKASDRVAWHLESDDQWAKRIRTPFAD